ncbi:MAG: pro-sigmaK processing inhibitor BofA family protein [Nanoarchaeota archaeon]|nr:pro-sigmaK processing inhibitor BofA family protein [Nanoarchaeota archaeon]MBU1269077.1 pro-sigmaK processing inhibitor BofA family protein [Nanoarchaeota archaeon]MBU1604730.1 pro-sigmaK processing inhibitor BofA family protein [Nanoarchaeota archaeon]MBU2442982.1 pro-sigmaK processing inhibitor BofA family protein [Nanoarchaeota archaeon]
MIVEIIAFLVVALIMFFLFKSFKKIIVFVINSVVGFLALFGFNAMFDVAIKINLWSILITGVGGSIGFVVILILHFLGLAF